MLSFRGLLLVTLIAVSLGCFVSWLTRGKAGRAQRSSSEYVVIGSITFGIVFFSALLPDMARFTHESRRTGVTNFLEQIRVTHSGCLSGAACDRVQLERDVMWGRFALRGEIFKPDTPGDIESWAVELSRRDALVFQYGFDLWGQPDTWFVTAQGVFRIRGPGLARTVKAN